MRNRIIKWLGGIPKDEVLAKVVKQLYNTIGPDDILREKDGDWLLKGKPITNETKKMIIAEAQIFSKSKLWKILQDDIRYKSNKLMFERSKTENDLIAGKLWLFTLDSFNTRLNSLGRASGRFSSDDSRES